MILLLALAAFACNRKPFVSHKVKLEKTADDCSRLQSSFRLNSNFGGERYEFEKCLPEGFDKEQIVSDRRGDTVLISFGTIQAEQKKAAYHITLDIDSYPAYSFLTIGEDTYTIGPSKE